MDVIETGCGCCENGGVNFLHAIHLNGICGCACHIQEEDEDGEYVYCHECNHPIHAYEEKVYNTDGKLICEDCLNGM